MNGYLVLVLFSGLLYVQAAPMGLGYLEAECQFDDLFPGHGLERPGGYVKFRQSLMGGPTLVHAKLEGFSAIDADLTHGLQINMGSGIHGFGNIGRTGCTPDDLPFKVETKPGVAAAGGAAAAAPVVRAAGDLGKITEDFEGNAMATFIANGIGLFGNNSVVGRTMSILDSGAPGQKPIVLGCCLIMRENGPILMPRHTNINGLLISGIH